MASKGSKMVCMTCEFKEGAYTTLIVAVFYTLVFIMALIDNANSANKAFVGILISTLVAVPMYGLSWLFFRLHRRQVAARLAERLRS